jgi:hypothetical protein
MGKPDQDYKKLSAAEITLEALNSLVTRGLPRPYSHVHVATKNQPLCYIPDRLVRAS